jgi:hypothetical protein
VLENATDVLLFLVIWETVGSSEREVRPIESWKDAGNIDSFVECSASKDTAKVNE